MIEIATAGEPSNLLQVGQTLDCIGVSVPPMAALLSQLQIVTRTEYPEGKLCVLHGRVARTGSAVVYHPGIKGDKKAVIYPQERSYQVLPISFLIP